MLWLNGLVVDVLRKIFLIFLEILTYDASDMDVTSREYASLKSVQCVNSANHGIMQTFLR